MLLNCGAGEDSWEFLGRQEDQTSQSWRKLTLNIHWKYWSWFSNSLATWCEELTHWKRPWCWERLRAGGEGGERGWDGWIASPTYWHEFERTPEDSEGQGKPWNALKSTGLQRLGHHWATEHAHRQIRTTMRHHHIPARMTLVKKTKVMLVKMLNKGNPCALLVVI